MLGFETLSLRPENSGTADQVLAIYIYVYACMLTVTSLLPASVVNPLYQGNTPYTPFKKLLPSQARLHRFSIAGAFVPIFGAICLGIIVSTGGLQ